MHGDGEESAAATGGPAAPLDPPPGFAVPDHRGPWYFEALTSLLRARQPQTYLEIGCEAGDTLALVECAAIAVDPVFRIERNVVGRKPACHLFQLTSDAFFAQYSPSRILGRPVDFAFLDGWHRFDFLLRDFINTEPHCRPGSLVVLHDCLPTDLHVARHRSTDRSRVEHSAHPDWWAGDAWKTLLILQKYRPDLRILCADAPPTGLVLIANLDPASTVLRVQYEPILAEYAALDLAGYGIDRLFAEADILGVVDLWPELAAIAAPIPGSAQG